MNYLVPWLLILISFVGHYLLHLCLKDNGPPTMPVDYVSFPFNSKTNSLSPSVFPPADNNSSSLFSVLVTYAQGEPFISTMKKLSNTWKIPGEFDAFESWNISRVLENFPQHKEFLTLHRGGGHRPGCMAHKSLVMLHAMNKYPNGSWIVWRDSSKYHQVGVTQSIKLFYGMLEKMKVTAYPGVPVCKLVNIDRTLMGPPVFIGMGLDLPEYWYAPHYQNAFFAFKNTQRNREFMSEWAKYNLREDTGCSSRVDDQASFSLLVKKYNFSAPFLCKEEKNYEDDPNKFKDANWLIDQLTSNQSESTFLFADQIIAKWRKFAYPRPYPS